MEPGAFTPNQKKASTAVEHRVEEHRAEDRHMEDRQADTAALEEARPMGMAEPEETAAQKDHLDLVSASQEVHLEAHQAHQVVQVDLPDQAEHTEAHHSGCCLHPFCHHNNHGLP